MKISSWSYVHNCYYSNNTVAEAVTTSLNYIPWGYDSCDRDNYRIGKLEELIADLVDLIAPHVDKDKLAAMLIEHGVKIEEDD